MPKRIGEALPLLGANETWNRVLFFTPEQVSRFVQKPCDFYLSYKFRWSYGYGHPDVTQFADADEEAKLFDDSELIFEAIAAIEKSALSIEWFRRLEYEEFERTVQSVYPDKSFEFSGDPQRFGARNEVMTISYWRSQLRWDIETDDALGKGRTLLEASTSLEAIDYAKLNDECPIDS